MHNKLVVSNISGINKFKLHEGVSGLLVDIDRVTSVIEYTVALVLDMRTLELSSCLPITEKPVILSILSTK